ncbi:hypothetical protein C8T65DRAFT_667703 [Cerioporus squamosus]|nr:hypothetical protein C8T65DRAFT_667703 [Cerioporus squamosus]
MSCAELLTFLVLSAVCVAMGAVAILGFSIISVPSGAMMSTGRVYQGGRMPRYCSRRHDVLIQRCMVSRGPLISLGAGVGGDATLSARRLGASVKKLRSAGAT